MTSGGNTRRTLGQEAENERASKQTPPRPSSTRQRCIAISLDIAEARTQLSLDAERHSIIIEDETVCLTRTEFRLLTHVVARRGDWVRSVELIQDVLGTHHRRDTPLVRVHIHSVRRKLGPRATWLESDPHRLQGYRWVGPLPERESWH